MVEVRDATQDEEFTELLGFLADPKLEVQKLAAEGVLAQTENQDFLAFVHEKPRAAAKPLMRLVERAEADVIAKMSEVAKGGSSGSADKDARARKLAAMEAETSVAAGTAALQALVNLSAVPEVRDELVELSAPRRCSETLRAGWLEGRSAHAHLYAMLLANISTGQAGQKALCENETLFHFLFAAFVTKPRPPPRDGCEDPLGYLAKLIGNVCALPEGRKLLAGGDQGAGAIAQLAAELKDRGRRADVLNAFRNLCVDEESHPAVVTTGVAPAMASFLYPWDKVAAEQRAQLPEGLRAALEEEGAALTGDTAVRNMAASCFLGLSRSEAGRAYLAAEGCIEVMRAWSAEESEEATRTAIDAVLQACQDQAPATDAA